MRNQRIQVELDPKTIDRIRSGPLKVTGGRGIGTWLRGLAERELDALECVAKGGTQVDIESLLRIGWLYNDDEKEDEDD